MKNILTLLALWACACASLARADYDIYPGAHITGRDARGEEAGGGWAVVKEDTGWKRFTVRFPLEPEAKTLRIAIGPFGAAGLLDVDDIEVEFQ